jgi:hypothetical protein
MRDGNGSENLLDWSIFNTAVSTEPYHMPIFLFVRGIEFSDTGTMGLPWSVQCSPEETSLQK